MNQEFKYVNSVTVSKTPRNEIFVQFSQVASQKADAEKHESNEERFYKTEIENVCIPIDNLIMSTDFAQLLADVLNKVLHESDGENDK